jgi:23S rRNA (uracil1939-C5)-methyltransferase
MSGRNSKIPKAITSVPVAVGQIVVCDIFGLTHEGEGVGRVEGYTLFVHGALPGEKVRAEVVSIGKSFGRARMVELLSESVHRREAPCSIYATCGGCQLQHLDYAEQLRWKRQHVVDNLVRIGKLLVDGEFGGTLPCTFNLLPAHLNVIMDKNGETSYRKNGPGRAFQL